MPQTYSFNPKQALTIDAPIRNFTVEQGSVVVSKHDEVIPTIVETGEAFSADDRGGLDFFSPDSATLTVLFTDEAKLAESGRHAGESEERTRKRQAKRRRKSSNKPKASTEADGSGGENFDGLSINDLREEVKKRDLKAEFPFGKVQLLAALRGE